MTEHQRIARFGEVLQVVLHDAVVGAIYAHFFEPNEHLVRLADFRARQFKIMNARFAPDDSHT